MVLSWLMPYFAPARRPAQGHTAKRRRSERHGCGVHVVGGHTRVFVIMETAARARGTLYGLAIGDALGMPTQMLSRAAIVDRWGAPDRLRARPARSPHRRGHARRDGHRRHRASRAAGQAPGQGPWNDRPARTRGRADRVGARHGRTRLPRSPRPLHQARRRRHPGRRAPDEAARPAPPTAPRCASRRSASSRLRGSANPGRPRGRGQHGHAQHRDRAGRGRRRGRRGERGVPPPRSPRPRHWRSRPRASRPAVVTGSRARMSRPASSGPPT